MTFEFLSKTAKSIQSNLLHRYCQLAFNSLAIINFWTCRKIANSIQSNLLHRYCQLAFNSLAIFNFWTCQKILQETAKSNQSILSHQYYQPSLVLSQSSISAHHKLNLILSTSKYCIELKRFQGNLHSRSSSAGQRAHSMQAHFRADINPIMFDPAAMPIRSCIRPIDELLSNCGPPHRKNVRFADPTTNQTSPTHPRAWRIKRS